MHRHQTTQTIPDENEEDSRFSSENIQTGNVFLEDDTNTESPPRRDRARFYSQQSPDYINGFEAEPEGSQDQHSEGQTSYQPPENSELIQNTERENNLPNENTRDMD